MATSDCIKVLMLGARHTGKSTLLASMVHSITFGRDSDVINVEDVTPYEQGEQTLSQKESELRKCLSGQNGKEVLVDSGNATSGFRDYTLKITIPGYKGECSLLFSDINGELVSFESGKIEDKDKLRKCVLEYDIILISIDTTYLMEASDPSNRIMSEPLNKMLNQVGALQSILTSIDDAEGKLAKMVYFVPIKGERWLADGQFDKVISRVEEVFDTHITALKSFTNIEIGIMPVETVGGVSFTTHRHAKTLTVRRPLPFTTRCSLVSESDIRKVILANGLTYDLKCDDILNDDSASMMGPFKVPYSWFRVTDRGYSPRDCDQLAYHILQFALAKTLAARRTERSERGFSLGRALFTGALIACGLYALAAGYAAYQYLRGRFGSINIEALSKALDTIRKSNDDKYRIRRLRIIKHGLLNTHSND